MNFSKKTAAILLIFLSGHLLSDNNKIDEAYDIIQRSTKQLNDANTSVIRYQSIPLASKIIAQHTLYFQKRKDGVTQKRDETEYLESNALLKFKSRVEVTNDQGEWVLLVKEKKAIRRPIKKLIIKNDNEEFQGILNEDFHYSKKYNLEDNASGMWKVTEDTLKQEKESQATLIIKKIFLIDKKTNLKKREEFYNNDGKLLVANDYDSIQVNIPLSNDLFEVPKGYAVIIPTTSEEFDLLVSKKTK